MFFDHVDYLERYMNYQMNDLNNHGVGLDAEYDRWLSDAF